MTDKLNGLLITLESDIREDDAQAIIDAIGMIKGVLDVSPLVTDYTSQIAKTRANQHVKDKLIKLFEELNSY